MSVEMLVNVVKLGMASKMAIDQSNFFSGQNLRHPHKNDHRPLFLEEHVAFRCRDLKISCELLF